MQETLTAPTVGFQTGEILDWTVLPAVITAAAWTDPVFRDALISSPTSVLRERLAQWPTDKTFTVSEDRGDLRFFPFPDFKPLLGDMTHDQALELLRRETGDDQTFDAWLPAEVMAAAFYEPEVKALLFESPTRALDELGFEPPADRVVVLENTRFTRHLALPVSPIASDELDFDMLLTELRDRYGQRTTKCCATGTCG